MKLTIVIWLLIFVNYCNSTTVINIGQTKAPSKHPTVAPTTSIPSVAPTVRPTVYPRPIPTVRPSSAPSSRPSSFPTISPHPTPLPTSQPTSGPSRQPSSQPSRQPTSRPSGQPSRQPTTSPSSPTGQPSSSPSGQPSRQPSSAPSKSRKPTIFRKPSSQPTGQPTRQPTSQPSRQPYSRPTSKPSVPTSQPTSQPSRQPSLQPYASPTGQPTSQPSNPTSQPSSQPTSQPVMVPTFYPSSQPTCQPSRQPTGQPTTKPSSVGTMPYFPSGQPTDSPSSQPSMRPTSSPTLTHHPSKLPSGQPSSTPTYFNTSAPTVRPTGQPSSSPTNPTGQPSGQPSRQPSSQPSGQPSRQPTDQPTGRPSGQPTSKPSVPTGAPSSRPSLQPSARPTSLPSITPRPSSQPTSLPSSFPSGQPSAYPTVKPTLSAKPTVIPTSRPTSRPTAYPTYYSLHGRSSRPTGVYETYGISGTVTLSPDTNNTCTPVEIRMSFKLSKNLPASSSIYITAPGITSGSCYLKENGRSLTAVSIDSFTTFVVTYAEGSYLSSYQGSQFTVAVQEILLSNQTYNLIIDRINGLRAGCNAASTWTIEAAPSGHSRGEIGFLDKIEIYPKKCHLFSSSILFSNALQQFPVAINVSVDLGFLITAGTTIKITMPGFTNARGGYPLNNMSAEIGDLVYDGYSRSLRGLTYNSNFSWTGYWTEGTYTNGYQDAYLTLTAVGTKLTMGTIWVAMDKEMNGIKPICGHPHNDPAFKISVTSSYYTIYQQSIGSSTSIGQSCDPFNSCSSNQGSCDYCTGKCNCYDGFGSERDRKYALAGDFAPDCSSKACPIGPAIGVISRNLNDTTLFTEVNMHRLMECSNNGICDRAKGRCKCFSGFSGPACQSMACSGNPPCSGRGRCMSMARLARTYAALPLTLSSYNYIPIQSGTPATWDYDFGRMCVCDSSWPVGLRAGETQQAEFFGPACQLRHCPTGDDPNTLSVDERNCTGKAMTGGIDLGEPGNLCHVDCSNRGLCDYKTGLCSCFSGYGGHNCGLRVPS